MNTMVSSPRVRKDVYSTVRIHLAPLYIMYRTLDEKVPLEHVSRTAIITLNNQRVHRFETIFKRVSSRGDARSPCQLVVTMSPGAVMLYDRNLLIFNTYDTYKICGPSFPMTMVMQQAALCPSLSRSVLCSCNVPVLSYLGCKKGSLPLSLDVFSAELAFFSSERQNVNSRGNVTNLRSLGLCERAWRTFFHWSK